MRALFLLCLIVGIGCHPSNNNNNNNEEAEKVLTCEGDEPAPPSQSPGACREGWCWANPLPQGLSLTAVWASGPEAAWMVGPAGTTVHARGDALELIDTGTQAALMDVWGSSDQDVWAAGEGGTLLHWEGARWQAVPGTTTENLTSLTGHSANDVWAAGTRGTLLHWNGVAWEQVGLASSAHVRDIASAGPDTVWLTTGGELQRCTPSGCQTVSTEARIGTEPFDLKELLSFSPDEVFALSTALLRWKDGAWSSLGTSDVMRFSHLSRLAGSGPEDLWVSAYYPGQYPLRKWQELRHFGTTSSGPGAPTTIVGETALPLRGLAAPSPGHLYLLSSSAQVFRLADEQWRSLHVDPPFRVAPAFDTPRALAVGEIVTDVAALPNGEVGVAALEDRPSWTRIRLFSDSAGNTWVAEASRVATYWLQGIFVETETLTLKVSRVGSEGTAVTHESAKPFDGDPSEFSFAKSIVGIHGSSERNVWVVSASDVLHWDGNQWNPVMEVGQEEQSEFTGAVWTTSPKAAWIGNTNGLFVWNGTQLERVELSGFKVSGLWASSSRDVWAVGARGAQPAAYHFDGSAWSEVELPAEAAGTGSLVDVVGRCESDVYLVGKWGAVLHWDGARWTTLPMPLGMSMHRAAKVGSELWVAGSTSGRANAIARHAW